jgi:hypothetical protein
VLAHLATCAALIYSIFSNNTVNTFPTQGAGCEPCRRGSTQRAMPRRYLPQPLCQALHYRGCHAWPRGETWSSAQENDQNIKQLFIWHISETIFLIIFLLKFWNNCNFLHWRFVLKSTGRHEDYSFNVSVQINSWDIKYGGEPEPTAQWYLGDQLIEPGERWAIDSFI